MAAITLWEQTTIGRLNQKKEELMADVIIRESAKINMVSVALRELRQAPLARQIAAQATISRYFFKCGLRTRADGTIGGWVAYRVYKRCANGMHPPFPSPLSECPQLCMAILLGCACAH